MRLRIDDDTLIEAATPEEMMRQMHALSHLPTDDYAEWMKETAHRTWQQTGQLVRWDTADNFIADMITAGLLRTVDDDKPEGEEDVESFK